MKAYSSIKLDTKSDSPLYIQLSLKIADMIRQGQISSGEKLPSIRALSSQLKVNNVTVVSAYKKLCNEGFIEASRGSGYYVRQPSQRFVISGTNVPPDEVYSSEDIQLLHKGSMLYGVQSLNMASTSPSLDMLNFVDIKSSVLATLENDGVEAFDFQDAQGYLLLREEIVRQLAIDGVHVKANNIHIVSGAQQGLDICAKALLNPSDTVVVEAPTYSGALAVFKTRGVNIERLQIEENGPDMEKLAQVLRRHKPKLIYSIPAYHNPTGYVYSDEKKQELIRLANAFGCYILEDDYLREMTYEGSTPKSLKSIDTTDRVILVKSYSKLLLPGLRIAFMVVPEEINNQITIAKHTTDIFTSGLIQRTFYRFLQGDNWRNHLGNIVPYYSKRYEHMKLAMKNILPKDVTYSYPKGGFSFWIKLPAFVDISSLYYMANTRGLSFVPGNIFSSDRYPINNYIRLSFAQVNDEAIDKGIYILNDCIKALKRGK